MYSSSLLNDKNIRFILIRVMPKKTKLDVKQRLDLTFILEQIWSHKKSGPFRYPVDYVKLNILDYPSIIEKPMDLSTVMKKLKNYEYRFVEDCIDDIDLIWENCLKYNRPTDWIASIAREMWKHQKKLMKNYMFEIYELKYRTKKNSKKNQVNRKGQDDCIKEKQVHNGFQTEKIKMEWEEKQINIQQPNLIPNEEQIQSEFSPIIKIENHQLNPMNYLNPSNKIDNFFNDCEQYNKELRQDFLNLLKQCNDCEVSLSFMMIKRRCFKCIQYDNYGNATINLEKVDDFTLELAKNQLLTWNRYEQIESNDD